MQCVLSSSTLLDASDLDAKPTFNVVIAYEDFDTGKHAKKTYDFLVENLGRECQFTNQMWKFDVLSIPKLREMAANDAVMADIIIISCHGSDELPEPVQAWIESWMAEKGSANALVALFDCPHEDFLKTRRIRNYLAEVAEKAGMEFFAQPDDWPGHRNKEGPSPFRRDSDLNGRTISTLAGVLQQDRSFPRWGINE
jgi:hypothetical protein